MPPPLSRGYRVFVDDNFHYMEEDERRCLGEFATYEEALQAARKLVEDFFDGKAGGKSEDELCQAYQSFGDDPSIAPFGGAPEPLVRFSAWDYARELSRKYSRGN